jgi:acyl carrier protein
MELEKVVKIVINQVEQLRDSLTEEQKFEVNMDTKLFGNNSNIDSLSLVSIIVDLEMLFSEEYGFDLSLTDDRAMTREISPFISITSLADYIVEIINNQPAT